MLDLDPDKFAGGLSRHTWRGLTLRAGSSGLVVMEAAMRCAVVEFIRALRDDGAELDYTNLATHVTDEAVFDSLAILAGNIIAEARSFTALLHTDYGVEAIELALVWVVRQVAEWLAEHDWLSIKKINEQAHKWHLLVSRNGMASSTTRSTCSSSPSGAMSERQSGDGLRHPIGIRFRLHGV